MIVIGLVGALINFVVIIYILFTIPIRVDKNYEKLKKVIDNQGVISRNQIGIEKKIDEILDKKS